MPVCDLWTVLQFLPLTIHASVITKRSLQTAVDIIHDLGNSLLTAVLGLRFLWSQNHLVLFKIFALLPLGSTYQW